MWMYLASYRTVWFKPKNRRADKFGPVDQIKQSPCVQTHFFHWLIIYFQKQVCKLPVFYSSVHQIDYPEIAEGIGPRHRFMSAYEQRIEPPDRRWQYLLLAAEPYETIAFKVSFNYTLIFLCSLFFLDITSPSLLFQVPSREIDKAENRFWTHWNRETKQVLRSCLTFITTMFYFSNEKMCLTCLCYFSSQFFLQFHFKMEKAISQSSGPPPPVGVKRPPPLMSGHRQPNDNMPPPPPGGMPPLPPGAPGNPHMPHQMPMPPMPMRPPPPESLMSNN